MNPGHGADSHDCREIFARLSEYLDEDLEPGLCDELERHLDDCPPCRAFLDSLRRTVDLVRDLPATELPEEVTRELGETYRKLREQRHDERKL